MAVNKESVSWLNSFLLLAVFGLVSWTLYGVQQLKEQNAANAVLISYIRESNAKTMLDLEVLRARVGLVEVEVAKTKQKVGIN